MKMVLLLVLILVSLAGCVVVPTYPDYAYGHDRYGYAYPYGYAYAYPDYYSYRGGYYRQRYYWRQAP